MGPFKNKRERGLNSSFNFSQAAPPPAFDRDDEENSSSLFSAVRTAQTQPKQPAQQASFSAFAGGQQQGQQQQQPAFSFGKPATTPAASQAATTSSFAGFQLPTASPSPSAAAAKTTFPTAGTPFAGFQLPVSAPAASSAAKKTVFPAPVAFPTTAFPATAAAAAAAATTKPFTAFQSPAAKPATSTTAPAPTEPRATTDETEPFDPRHVGVLNPSNNSVALFLEGYALAEKKGQPKQPVSPEDTTIEIQSCAPSIDRHRRQLMYDGHGIYAYIRLLFHEAFEVRQAMERRSTLELAELEVKYDELHNAMVALSKKYDRALREYVANVAADPECSELAKEVADSCVAIWSLCDVLYFNDHVEVFLAPEYMTWLNETFRVEKPAQVVNAQSANDDSFWSSVIKLTLRYELGQAVQMLRKLQDAIEENVTHDERQGLDDVAGLLESSPNFFDFPDPVSFRDEWQSWQAECGDFHDEYSLNTNQSGLQRRLFTVLAIIRGSEETIREHSDRLYEAIGAYMIYTRPEAEMEELREELDRWEDFPTGDSALETAVVAFLSGDIAKGLRIAASVDSWLVTHLADTFVKLEFDADDEQRSSVLLPYKEYFVQEYATYLAGDDAMWEVGLDYLGATTAAKQWQQTAIIRIPIDSELKGQRLLAACDKYGLPSAARHICEVIANKYLGHGRYAAALKYYMKANDAIKITRVAEMLLDSYLDNAGEANYRPILQSLGAAVHSNVRLSFLARLQQYHDLYSDNKLKEAAKILIELLVSHSAPKRVWAMLLVDAIPLLEGDAVIFDVESTYELMRCLDDIVLSHRKDEYLRCLERMRRCEAKDVALQLDVVRLALARNLARALMVYEQSGQAM